MGNEENYVYTNARDPSAGDPHHYRVLLDEHRARVVGIRLGAHEKTNLVKHTDGVLIALTEAHLAAAGSAGQPSRFDLLRGQASWWPAGTEAIENTAESSCEIAWIELKQVSFPREITAERSTPAKAPVGGAPGRPAIEILTPTEGVNFDPYVAGVFGNVRRNWYAVMPEAARRGERGTVVVEFSVLHDGKISEVTPISNSGSRVLDAAALAAVRASNPLDPLPKEFHGPSIKLRFTFLYNLPAERVTGP